MLNESNEKFKHIEAVLDEAFKPLISLVRFRAEGVRHPGKSNDPNSKTGGRPMGAGRKNPRRTKNRNTGNY